jgi:cell division protease FtsH
MEKPEIQEGGLYTKDILKKRLIVSLGGKAAESLMYGDKYVSLGAREDLKQANSLAGQMINSFGMGDQLEVFSANEEKQFRNVYSETIKTVIDEESLYLVVDAFEEAKELLEKHKEQFIALSHLLMNETNLYKKDVQKIFSNNTIYQ